MDTTAMRRCTTQWCKFGACMFGRSGCSPAKHDGEAIKYSRRKSLETTQQIFAGLARFYCWRAAHSSVIWESRLLLVMYTFCASTSNHMWCLIHSGVIWQCSFSNHICLHFSTDFYPPAPLPLLSLPSFLHSYSNVQVYNTMVQVWFLYVWPIWIFSC